MAGSKLLICQLFREPQRHMATLLDYNKRTIVLSSISYKAMGIDIICCLLLHRHPHSYTCHVV